MSKRKHMFLIFFKKRISTSKSMKKHLFTIIITCFLINSVKAQTEDNILWSQLSLHKKFDEKNALYITPTLRTNNNLKSYQNSSIDIHYAHKVYKHWGLGFISRTWFVPDAGDRQFLWFDIRYSTSINAIKVFSGLRYHLALDINENIDPDFIRWKTKLTFPSFGILTPHLAIEPWLRLNGFEQLQLVRYEPGVDLQLQKNLKLSMTYWRQETINLEPNSNFNIYVVKATYSI